MNALRAGIAMPIIAAGALILGVGAAKPEPTTHVVGCITVVERSSSPDGNQTRYWVKFFNACDPTITVKILQVPNGYVSTAYVPGHGYDVVRCWSGQGCQGFASDWSDYE